MTTDKAAVAAAASAAAASEAMEKGNSFYAAGNFDEGKHFMGVLNTRSLMSWITNFSIAIVQYLKAIAIEPTNPTARRNLTAVLYEQGDYPACLGAIEAALHFEVEDSKRTILRVRRAKCHFFMGYFEEAKVALQEAIDGGAEKQEGFMKAVESYLALPKKDKKVAFEDVASIPRLRPNL
jgi:tetratricopeptide (TPR) repeat protein